MEQAWSCEGSGLLCLSCWSRKGRICWAASIPVKSFSSHRVLSSEANQQLFMLAHKYTITNLALSIGLLVALMHCYSNGGWGLLRAGWKQPNSCEIASLQVAEPWRRNITQDPERWLRKGSVWTDKASGSQNTDRKVSSTNTTSRILKHAPHHRCFRL